MAKENETRKKVIEKRTSQGGARPKTSSMSKSQKRGFKPYRGQGK
jgi:hypothetical protein